MLGFLLQQFQHIIVEIYGFFFMLYNINTLPALKRAVYEDFYWLMGKGDGMQKPSVVLNDENTDERFKHLRDMWDGKLSDNT
ncbi:unnamed protein product [Bursaphelenchus okinawaensis]|uniref:Uncharacterized protein n=1 Tax=Bursaphelenchus okinawaensis TaxID=465554 RepID=A0A811LSF9_9BILA|nr:unnamed protein product [Bursaphelenchus okinawaensis]CAG9127837.1 unnamed protein product [Bursaphelenchus okinawaensis]